ncbi:MAG: hypothetical protein HXS52_09295 [Theionarchaea archaeon]|nr:hypothetical protein [Theionarchaea archaeon]MBU7038116.1 hypothetical protein [Theionarchaea archaeon]
MTLRLIFHVSEPLNFLGYARNQLSSEKSHLWSREVESLFVSSTSLDAVLSSISLPIRREVTSFRDSFSAEWPAFSEELREFKQHLERVWDSNQKRIISLMEELWIFYDGILDVFPVMSFFRPWPRSTPLSIPLGHQSDQKVLELLTHEILHRTTESDNPQSIWRYLSIVFTIQRLSSQSRFLIQHAFIFVAASWIVSHSLKTDFQIPQLNQDISEQEQLTEMERYVQLLFRLFSSEFRTDNPMQAAETLVECCQQKEL